MTPKLHIAVAEPCQENWEAMTPAAQGRHCNACSKTVVDFTRFSDDELFQYFKKKPTNICGRYQSEQLNRPIQSSFSIWNRVFTKVCGFFISLLGTQAMAQSGTADVEVIRLSGPGTEPVFRQWSDSMEFNFKLKSGLVASDPDLKFIKVEGDSFSLQFEKMANGEFDIFVPNVWNDTVYTFSFYDQKRQLLGVYPIPVADAHKYLNAKVHIHTMPQAEILVSRGIYGTTITTMGVTTSSGYYPHSINFNTLTISGLPGIYPVTIPTRNEGKIPVHLSPKVEFGTHDLPGINPFPPHEAPGD